MIGWAEVRDDDDELIYVVPIAELPNLPTLGARVTISTHGSAARAFRGVFKLEHTAEGDFIKLPKPECEALPTP